MLICPVRSWEATIVWKQTMIVFDSLSDYSLNSDWKRLFQFILYLSVLAYRRWGGGGGGGLRQGKLLVRTELS